MCDKNEISPEFRDLFSEYWIDNVSVQIDLDCAYLERKSQWVPMLVVGIFVVLLTIGVIGCCTTALRIYMGVVRSSLHMNGTLVYVTALCVIDLASTLSIVPLIVDELHGVWPLGTVLCRLDVVLEWVGKVFNTYMLLAISFERYVAVCRPHHHALLGRRFAVLSAAGLLFFGALQMLPIFFGSAVTFIHHDLFIEPPPPGGGEREPTAENASRRLHATVLVTRQCEFDGTGVSMEVYLMWLCLSSFVVPLLLNVGLSWLTFGALRRRGRAARNRRRRDAHARLIGNGWSSLFLTIFYAVCFLPHWISTVGVIVLEHALDSSRNTSLPSTSQSRPLTESLAFTNALYALHVLPYVNSSFNWILYGVMNNQLRTVRYSGSGVSTRARQRASLTDNVSQQAVANHRRWMVRHACGAGVRTLAEWSVGFGATELNGEGNRPAVIHRCTTVPDDELEDTV